MYYSSSKINLLLLILSLHFLPAREIYGKETVDESYRERVHLQVGRGFYITGETIWFKAFTFSNLQNIYSKALYIELVDTEYKHILGQIVEISGGVAVSSFAIPDTLTSGMYAIKAYTNWMRNFNTGHFATFPLYIFNQYDDTEAENTLDYTLLPDPDIYIENGKLIHQARTRVKIIFPGWMSDTLRGDLRETRTGSKIADFLVGKDGKGTFVFTPVAGNRYRLEIQITPERNLSIDLPAVESVSPAININSENTDYLFIQPVNLPVKSAYYKLVARKGDSIIWEKNITGSTDDSLTINPGKGTHGLFTFELLDKAEHTIADKNVYIQKSREQPSVSDNSFKTRSPVAIPIESLSTEYFDSSNLSISVYKSAFPESQAEVFISTTSFFENLSIEENGQNYQVLLSLYDEMIRDDMPVHVNEDGNPLFPVEDIGILYSGRVVNSINDGAIAGVEVMLSVKDTIPQLLLSNTDKQGRFFFLIDDYGKKYALINLYLLGAQLSGSFKIILDDKFYYRKNMQLISEINLEKEDVINKYFEDEAQRVLIQRAYNREETIADSAILAKPIKPFYSDDADIVVPSEYFDLPNFEEIAREIIPEVRYKYTKQGCKIIVFNTEYGIKSSSPIVLLDGLPVKDYCELYPLRSEDINRIEIVPGANVSGNLFSEAVVAVYYTSSYRTRYTSKNGRLFHDVSGYYNSPVFSSSLGDSKNGEKSKLADFKNQLLWDPGIEIKDHSGIIRFSTSDEEATYTIDICGYTYNGELLRIKRMFNVRSE